MSDRLTKTDWIRQGLHSLASEGPTALKVGPMSARLKVSRGSFYWHFRDIADFRSQVLRSWQERSTDRIIQDLDARKGEPGRLKQLMQEAFSSKRDLDRAMRSWASVDEDVASVVASVDARRIAQLMDLLVEAGVPREAASHRATFLYWAYLGQTVTMHPGHCSMSERGLDEIGSLFES
jgi:AcrR family transcriptional regulator